MTYFDFNLPTFVDHHNRYIGRPGDRLRADHWWGQHVGTLNWDGRVWAASKKFNGIRLVNFDAFSDGKPVTNEGNVGTNSRTEVLENYAALESDGYCVFTKNCEHIDNFVRGLRYKSPQVATALFVAATACLVIASARR